MLNAVDVQAASWDDASPHMIDNWRLTRSMLKARTTGDAWEDHGTAGECLTRQAAEIIAEDLNDASPWLGV